MSTLESRLERVEDEVDKYGDRAAGAGLIVFVIGCFCALWAQNSGRSAWLWFFLGCFFHVITLLVLLSKNSNDLANRSV